MGKGDKKTKKGKRFLGSYGVTRKQKVKKVTATTPVEKTKAPKPAKEKVTKEAVEEKPKAAKKAAAETKPKAPKKQAAEKKEAAPKAAAKKKAKEE